MFFIYFLSINKFVNLKTVLLCFDKGEANHDDGKCNYCCFLRCVKKAENNVLILVMNRVLKTLQTSPISVLLLLLLLQQQSSTLGNSKLSK